LLLTHDDVYVEASRIAMEDVFGLFAEGPDIPGDTAPAHIRRALGSVGVPEEEIDAGLPRWCETFGAQYVHLLEVADTSHWQLAPHAFEAAAAVEHRALLTGNPPVVAHARMERLGLAELFPRGQGAFGCERENRIELFDLARKRAGDWPAHGTVGVGDTPLDVASAHAAACRSIAVTTGNYGREKLGAADVVIENLGELESALATLT
jgi:phosphoglycolate phosphatase-like HAD superfamily hydrolase